MMPHAFLVFHLTLLLSAPAMAQPYGPIFVNEITGVYDGDTFYVNIVEWPPIIGNNMPVRIQGINTPELRSRCDTDAAKEAERERARKAKAFVEEQLREADTIVLHNIERGSFFRLIADVKLDGRDLGDLLIAAGHAQPYEPGAGGQAWCQP
ncbi:hypothetical protein GCM10007160_13610 [Litchfieldella qijiaojingensis]|uniref:Nuclease n=1 Tax=Litchfieldella qijiaojingensis TaxID=980347 RepID=A0ABQ2YNF5_9GAMM|nr:thermonuclease family protein [Halomonas qijiaojingensis]GGX87484.1 hypothetical protein GCM10007160_13610 [Halomonas qijiaojingensis]